MSQASAWPAISESWLAALRTRIDNETLAALFDYWRELRRGRRMPSRADIDPLTIPRAALAHCVLIDVIWKKRGQKPEPRLRYRLIGTAVVATREGLVPVDPTGWYFDQVPFRLGDLVVQFYGGVAISGRPDYHSGIYAPDHPRFAGTYYRVALPLSEDGREVNMLFGGFCRGP